ncbi:hypothetical protein F4778DRAFT_802447 [Xylariomycetidae sp. FL2044]|nr:hypothetical protein F4778DRAFT_802447 [Xylariomycetidae sp. FL2044]
MPPFQAPHDDPLSIPELLELILLHLDPRTLLVSAPRVRRFWHATITTSPPLQRALFFLADPADPNRIAHPVANGLLREAFPSIFERTGAMESVHRPTPAPWIPEGVPATVGDLLGRRGFGCRDASWRRMLVRQPPLRGVAYYAHRAPGPEDILGSGIVGSSSLSSSSSSSSSPSPSRFSLNTDNSDNGDGDEQQRRQLSAASRREVRMGDIVDAVLACEALVGDHLHLEELLPRRWAQPWMRLRDISVHITTSPLFRDVTGQLAGAAVRPDAHALWECDVLVRICLVYEPRRSGLRWRQANDI